MVTTFTHFLTSSTLVSGLSICQPNSLLYFGIWWVLLSFFRTQLQLFVFQPPAFAPPMLHFSSPIFPLYESTSNSLLLTTARCLNTGWQTTSKQDGAKKPWAPLGPLFNKSRLSTAALPTLTMPWWQPETVRPTLAPSEGFPQQPGGKPQCYIAITLHSAKSDHDLKSVGTLLRLATLTNIFIVRYEVRVVAVSSAGQSSVERAVYTLTAGESFYILNLLISWWVRVNFRCLTSIFHDSDRRRCSLFAKPLTTASQCKPR